MNDDPDRPGDPEPSLHASDRETSALVALATIPDVGAATMLRCHRGPGAPAALEALAAGNIESIPALDRGLRRRDRDAQATVRAAAVAAARSADPDRLLADHRRAGRRVVVADRVGYPPRLARFPSPPPVVFLAGDERPLLGPTVAIIGTRNATRAGREFAAVLGRDLTAAGVSVVSGLALGIDGAAHRGALDALDADDADGPEATRAPRSGPVGVIASGLDIAYPRAHQDLHGRVLARGLLVSETPLGVRPLPWRFPARNRIIARLADAVVVVESRRTGGSMTTVALAQAIGIDVLAVPGHPLAPASAGTNDLIFDGGAPVRDATDVLVAIGVDPPRRRPAASELVGSTRCPAVPADLLGDAGRAIVEALALGPASLAEVIGRSGLEMDEVAVEMVGLVERELVVETAGWFELAGRGLAAVRGGRTS
jgi:DNA processing protein